MLHGGEIVLSLINTFSWSALTLNPQCGQQSFKYTKKNIIEIIQTIKKGIFICIFYVINDILENK